MPTTILEEPIPPSEIPPALFLDLDEVEKGFKLSEDRIFPTTLLYDLPTDLELAGLVE